ncbi:uncharacterized protein LOC135152154 [Daucus carota subsp. sativus]|uniref:uncharacterized protein LOC135152154 n=1 Tax=Daucus carota subsp. sativus TaxID=79200 RepID=UPI003082C526
MSEKSQNSNSRYESIRVPILKASEYPVWKVKMVMFLEATDPEYLDMIYDGPHMPTKLSVAVGDEPQKMIPKEKKDYTPEDISSISKDAKVKHLLHSALDNVMSNRVIGCKIAKEIWDALEIRYLYDRFVKLLNDLSLVDKECDLEDSNLKFLLALPEKWDLKRNKRYGGKPKHVALKVQEETAVKNKGKAHVTKPDTESSNSDDNSNSDIPSDSEDNDTEMMHLAALMVKSFKKIAYKNFNKGKKFTRKDGNSDRKGFKKNEGKEEKSGKSVKSKFTCFNCGEKGHFETKWKKAKNEKGQAFITKKGNWADSSDTEEEVNYALMANTDNSSETVETKLPHSTLAFNTEDITELRLFLKSLHISFRDQTLENERLKFEVLDVKKRNDYLDKELVQMLEVQKERDDVVFVKNELLKKHASFESELAKERDIIKTWTNSGKTAQNILGSGNWKKGLGYTDKYEAEPTKPEKNKDINTMSPKSEVKTRNDNMKNILNLDSGCSRHMTGNKALLSEFMEKASPNVSYGDGNIGKTLGYGNINFGNIIIESVVKSMTKDFMSISLKNTVKLLEKAMEKLF